MAAFDSDNRSSGAGSTLTDTDNTNFASGITGIIEHTFSNGINSGALGTSEYNSGFDFFEDKDQVEVDFLIAPSLSGCLLYTSPSPRDKRQSRMPSSA